MEFEIGKQQTEKLGLGKRLGHNLLIFFSLAVFIIRLIILELAVINLVENGTMDKKDFIVTENYNLRLRGLGGKKVANEFSNMMNQAVGYGDKQTTWGSTLLLKAEN